MPILGIGTDIVEIKRVEEIARRTQRFCARVFRPSEIAYCNSRGKSRYASLAARFAAKEAVAKALGRPLSWQDVEVVTLADGRPIVKLHGPAQQLAQKLRVHISLAHSKDYAHAVAVVEVDENQ
ncbi:MAG: holo-ACP synthase [Armatimonadota bacterium]|nr:holo-ACP synthase [Armatimonadota bacterium]